MGRSGHRTRGVTQRMTSDPGGQGVRVRCGGSLLQKRKRSLEMKGPWPRAVSFANLSVPHIQPQAPRPGKEEKQVPVQTGHQVGVMKIHVFRGNQPLRV